MHNCRGEFANANEQPVLFDAAKNAMNLRITCDTLPVNLRMRYEYPLLLNPQLMTYYQTPTRGTAARFPLRVSEFFHEENPAYDQSKEMVPERLRETLRGFALRFGELYDSNYALCGTVCDT